MMYSATLVKSKRTDQVTVPMLIRVTCNNSLKINKWIIHRCVEIQNLLVLT